MPEQRIEISDHAARQLSRRGIDAALLEHVVREPDQIVPIRPGRETRQSRISEGRRPYLLRVVIDLTEDALVVVTMYKTNRIEKYWQP